MRFCGGGLQKFVPLICFGGELWRRLNFEQLYGLSDCGLSDNFLCVYSSLTPCFGECF